jgi:hypothetical protein
MKTIVGWLGDPYLHLVGIGLIVLAIGAGINSEPGRGEASDRCDLCHRFHDESLGCPNVPNALPR